MRLSDIFVKKTPYRILQTTVILVLAYLLLNAIPKQQEQKTGDIPAIVPNASTVSTSSPQATTSPKTNLGATTLLSTPPTKPKPVTFSTIKLEAKSAIVYDISSAKVLYAKNPDEHLPIASITKVMTAFTASTYLPPDTIITISNEDAAVESSAGITAGEQWPIKDLIAFTLVASSNGGAQALARTTEETTYVDFISQMNGLAKELGLSDSLFRNPTGLDMYDAQMSGSYSTASDIAKLFTYISENDPVLMTGTNRGTLAVYSSDNVRHQAINTNLLVTKVPNIEMSKTGFTDLAGGSVAIIFEPQAGHKIAVVVLGSTSQGRFNDLEKLTQATTLALKSI